MRSCSFCGEDESKVSRLIEGGGDLPAGSRPRVHICDQCIGLCAGIIDEKREAPVYQRLRDWAWLEIDGVRYRWSAVRTTVTTQDLTGRVKDRRPMVFLIVGKADEPATGVAYPDGTEPTEELALDAIRRSRQGG